MIIIKLIELVALFIAFPLIFGTDIWTKAENRNKKLTVNLVGQYLTGSFLMWGTFEVIAVPLILLKVSFMTAVVLWTVALVVIMICQWKYGIAVSYKKLLQKGKDNIQKLNKKEIFLYLIMLGLILYQFFYCVFGTQLDEDDARFVVNAVEAYNNNSMLLIHPATGEYAGTWVGELAKDVPSPWMIFVAALSKIAMIHPTIMAHTILPGVLVTMAYGVYWLIAQELFPKNKEEQELFVIFVSLINIHFSNTEYTAAVFLLTRIWQGKAVVAGIIIPFIFYLFMLLRHEKKNNYGYWIVIGLTDLAACLLSGMGIILVAMLIGILAVCYSVTYKDFRILLRSILACIPSILFGVIYVII